MIRKFRTLEDALAAGFSIVLGNGEYAEGGEIVSRSRYAALYEAITTKDGQQAEKAR